MAQESPSSSPYVKAFLKSPRRKKETKKRKKRHGLYHLGFRVFGAFL